MEISLTELAELLAPKQTAPHDPAPLHVAEVGQHVILRSRDSGVWAGDLDALDATPAGFVARMTDARRIWSWEGANELSELARLGPTGGKIAAPVAVTVLGCCEVIATTEACRSALTGVAPWAAR